MKINWRRISREVAMESEIKRLLEEDLSRAQEQWRKIRKQVDAGATHESRLDFAEGLVAGLESAIAIVCVVVKRG